MEEQDIVRTDNLELREEMFELLKQSHPKGNSEAQRSFCFSLHSSRIQTYMNAFSEGAEAKGKKSNT
jgi:hypothetical protein